MTCTTTRRLGAWTVVFGAVLVSYSGEARAAGFAVAEQGAASVGVAGAATARSDLAETAWYNPAATPAGFNAAIGGSLIFPTLRHTDPESGVTTTSEGGPATPPYVHLGWVGEFGRHRAGLVAVGNVPFGAGLQWPADWHGRFEVTEIELQVFEASASAIYGISLGEVLDAGVSASFRAMRSTVELKRKVDAIDSEGSAHLGGDANAFGFGAATHLRWNELSVGVNYRAPATLDYEGAAHFEDIPPELSGPAHDQAVMTSVSLPSRVAVGAAYDLGFGTASVEMEHFGWSTFETFAIDFADDETPDVEEPRNLHDTVTLRAGYEHRLLTDRLALRGGAAYDPTPSPDESLSPTLPDSSRLLLTVGAGYAIGFGLRVDASFAHIALLGAEAAGEESFPGRYDGSAEVFSVGLSFRR